MLSVEYDSQEFYDFTYSHYCFRVLIIPERHCLAMQTLSRALASRVWHRQTRKAWPQEGLFPI